MTLYLATIGGVITSIVLPPLSLFVRTYFQKMTPATAAVTPPQWLTALKPYALLGLFSAITGLMIIAAVGDTIKDWHWHHALIAGYAWDSTLQKLAKS